MSNDSAARGAEEDLDTYIARLEAIDPSGLSTDDQLALTLSLSVARRKRDRAYLGAEVPEPPALERCKEAIRKLSRTDRKQLLRWLAGGALD
jgi:hypothetical protein